MIKDKISRIKINKLLNKNKIQINNNQINYMFNTTLINNRKFNLISNKPKII